MSAIAPMRKRKTATLPIIIEVFEEFGVEGALGKRLEGLLDKG